MHDKYYNRFFVFCFLHYIKQNLIIINYFYFVFYCFYRDKYCYFLYIFINQSTFLFVVLNFFYIIFFYFHTGMNFFLLLMYYINNQSIYSYIEYLANILLSLKIVIHRKK
ncbi:hypothetical protein EDEG_04008 [Edhazardia aedis USNM 41457]|uniref:Uncharacterized protein n=1 Tax=Edhazardia aedis (strain USNM 41457) TaxID=1003232 RepID=J9DIZ8_EDHAE|nr:hypothetical protein EDEG_04008 [Edhazardia aedis USNM 41457]|eukprot:EJW01362.1 hypothetical protein EDEG_04008 [Edhazardia aedis USNM 41457]